MMPVTSFPEYAQAIENALHAVVTAGEAVLLDVRVDQRSSLRGFISGCLQFSDGSKLHFREFVDTSLPEPRLMYAYHYETGESLGFRYDNASHRPSLPQAEHKHTPAGVQLCSPPTLVQAIDEALSLSHQ